MQVRENFEKLSFVSFHAPRTSVSSADTCTPTSELETSLVTRGVRACSVWCAFKALSVRRGAFSSADQSGVWDWCTKSSITAFKNADAIRATVCLI
ncbi:hypothetical protein LR48_Vigan07g239700 [Vigna angularis]|uniref:Uncharacterized protein n=1 Tax=Phaseolus angularis TaxID=3914 RepID=A0A0L9V0Y1_PHAAN|nr:hypothetical protein LR48_Vigan07g239700 [Vigna angularis]